MDIQSVLEPRAYPAQDATDPNFLFQGLGTFWNLLFQEQDTLRGLTVAQAEEAIQRYQELVEVINEYSVKDMPLLKTVNWYPILLRKSQFNRLPLEFYTSPYSEQGLDPVQDPEHVVFGWQPNTSVLYPEVLFAFGGAKTPATGEVFTHTAPEKLKDFSLLTDRLISPTQFLTQGMDVYVFNGVLYFRINPFDHAAYARFAAVDDFGAPAYFIDSNGQRQRDEYLVIWAYHAGLDDWNLYHSYGYLFELRTETTEFYHQLIKGLVNLYTEGATLLALKSMMALFTGNQIVSNVEERVEDVQHDGVSQQWIVVTDKQVYRFSNRYQLLTDKIYKGATLRLGDVLNDSVTYYDNVSAPGWWMNAFNEAYGGAAMFPSYLFLGNYEGNLVFPNSFQQVQRTADDRLDFPLVASERDRQTFLNNLNQRTVEIDGELVASKEVLFEQLGLSTSSSTVLVNPVDFLFTHFFKSNTAFIKLNLLSPLSLRLFSTLSPIIRKILPKHVYFMFYFETSLLNEVLDLEAAALDGSDAGGVLEFSGSDTLFNQFDITNNFMAWTAELYRGSGYQIPDTSHNIACNQYVTDISQTIVVCVGGVSTVIRSDVPVSNKEVRTLQLYDFSPSGVPSFYLTLQEQTVINGKTYLYYVIDVPYSIMDIDVPPQTNSSFSWKLESFNGLVWSELDVEELESYSNSPTVDVGGDSCMRLVRAIALEGIQYHQKIRAVFTNYNNGVHYSNQVYAGGINDTLANRLWFFGLEDGDELNANILSPSGAIDLESSTYHRILSLYEASDVTTVTHTAENLQACIIHGCDNLTTVKVNIGKINVLSDLPKLENLTITDSSSFQDDPTLEALDLSTDSMPALKLIHITGNTLLEEVDISMVTNLEELQLYDYAGTYCTAVETVDCTGLTKLKVIRLLGCASLSSLVLDVTENTDLTWLQIEDAAGTGTLNDSTVIDALLEDCLALVVARNSGGLTVSLTGTGVAAPGVDGQAAATELQTTWGCTIDTN